MKCLSSVHNPIVQQDFTHVHFITLLAQNIQQTDRQIIWADAQKLASSRLYYLKFSLNVMQESKGVFWTQTVQISNVCCQEQLYHILYSNH